MQNIGISDIAFATGSNFMDLAELANYQGIDPQKYYSGIGQKQMSVPSVDEDIVTMAATAAKKILDRNDSSGIKTIIFATESGIDQSKSAGVFVHGLLGLPNNVRVVELKQACYSGTAALQFAAGVVALNPKEQVLVIASDVSRYALDSAGEATQGAGAVAILVSAEPKILAFEAASGRYTQDVMDFWRPNYLDYALVDGKYSIQVYLTSAAESFRDYRENGGAEFSEIDYFCYHQPFTKMAVKAHKYLNEVTKSELSEEQLMDQISDTTVYNRQIGNSYTAPIHLGFLSLLDHAENLAGKRVAFLSYGSGSVAEFFTGIVQDGYKEKLTPAENQAELDSRTELNFDQYRQRYNFSYPSDGSELVLAKESKSPFRLAKIQDHIRVYEKTGL